MDMPKVITLATPGGVRVGLMLLAPDEENSGGCVFMLLPVSSTVIESDMGIVISELKVAGEHRFIAKALDNGIDVLVVPTGLPQVQLQLNHEFKGSVFTDFGGTIKCIGSAELLPSSA
jgi:hypothetical protein